MFSLPLGFYLTFAVLVAAAIHAWRHRREGWGLPAMAVYGTVFAWYLGDVLTNDFDTYRQQFSSEVIDAAWMQVVFFLVCFAALAPKVNRAVNRSLVQNKQWDPDKRQWMGRTGVVVELMSKPDAAVRLGQSMETMFVPLASVWLFLTSIALVRTDFDWRGIFAPWMGHLADPWMRGRLGGGIDFLLSAASIVNLFCLAGFGIVAALAKSRRVLIAAACLIFITWPLVIFDRARNTMLVLVLPGLLCFIFIRLRGHKIIQAIVLVSCFLVVTWWFGFVMAHRSSEGVAAAFAANKVHDPGAAKFGGMNMFQELCYVDKFLDEGTYRPNWGQRYFAEAVNMIPRTIWPNKPTIGLDYSMLRMRGAGQMDETQLTTTVSTGMIGQGVVNFGSWGGPFAAALLMSLWTAMLARFDFAAASDNPGGPRFGRMPLYVLGLVLTYNLGREITLLVAYPIFFGYLVVRVSEKALGAAQPHL
jgi:hypothetical protein